MPYYAWRGVDILGEYKKGKMYARSREALDAQLFKREIALISSRPTSWRWRYGRISESLKIEFFKQLATLVDGGVSIPESLLVAAEQLHHPGMQEIIHELADKVESGNALSLALCRYPTMFDPITIQLIKAGEESGALAVALHAIADRLEIREEFARSVRSALILPALTFGFFLLITIFLFTFVVPQFAQLFASMNHELPATTRAMMRISALLTAPNLLIIVGLIAIFSYLVHQWSKTKQGKRIKDSFVLHVPVINRIIWYRFVAYFLASLALLLERGLQLVPALQVIAQSVDNYIFKSYVLQLAHAVNTGRSLSSALQDLSLSSDMGVSKFPVELIALVHVGENSGTLDVLLAKAAVRYQSQVTRMLKRLSSFVQPTLMIVLGLLVLLLIFAIYLPIIELSHII